MFGGVLVMSIDRKYIIQSQMQFTPASNVCEAASRSLFWAVNGLNKVLEMHFNFPFNLIGK